MTTSARARPTRVVALVLGAAALAVLPSCGSDGDGAARAVPTFTVGTRVPADQATGLAVAPDGSILVGELLTGRIFSFQPGDSTVTERAQLDDLDTSPTQRGLLGLTVAPDGTALVALTNAEDRIEVREVASGGLGERRWLGPTAQDQANGGRIGVLANGRLAIGIGDLLDPDRTPDPDAPNGKLLAIDEAGVASPLATGLNNPFALTVAGDEVWIADNAPGKAPERLLRVVDGELEEVASWTETRVPSGVAVLPDGNVAICNYATGLLSVVDPGDAGDASGAVVADDCRYGVVTTAEGGLAYATDDAVVVLDPTP